MENTLEKALALEKLEPETKKVLITNFEAFKQSIDEVKGKAMSLIVTDETQVELMSQAADMKKVLAKYRTSVEKRRKELKADSLAYGRAIDNVAKAITAEIQPLEDHCEQQARYAELQEQARKSKIRQEREAALAEFQVNTKLFDLENMEEQDFTDLLESSKVTYQAKLEAAARAAEEEKARRELEIQSKARLVAEAEEQRQKAEAARKEANEAKRKLEELKAESVRLAQEQARREDLLRQREAAAKVSVAPTGNDWLDFAKKLRGMPLPPGNEILEHSVRGLLVKVADYILQKTNEAKSSKQ